MLVGSAIPAQELNVFASAARVGVGHVMKITSNASADLPIALRRDQAEIENGLIASGLGCTLPRSSAYMQNFLMLAPAIAETSSFGSSAGDGPRLVMHNRRSVAWDLGKGERSVKPSAQPTLVRTQHLPPPAKTAR